MFKAFFVPSIFGIISHKFKGLAMKLCIALDMNDLESNLSLAQNIANNFPTRVKNGDIWLKVGLNAFIRDGVPFINTLQNLGYKIFLDLKLYDIPNTMLNAIKEIQNLNIDMITIHASSGLKAMECIAKYILDSNSNMLIIAVSALTSFNNDEFMQIYNTSIESSVRNFANLAYKSGINGLVCSINEVEIIKNVSSNLIAVTPGIRDCIESKDDQKRIATPQSAKEKGSDFIVVGRPIYNAKDKIKTLDSILQTL